MASEDGLVKSTGRGKARLAAERIAGRQQSTDRAVAQAVGGKQPKRKKKVKQEDLERRKSLLQRVMDAMFGK